MPKEYSVDQKSYDLAEYFLEVETYDSEENRRELAQVIQDAVEDWCTEKEECESWYAPFAKERVAK